MTKLTKAELKAVRLWLETWRRPDEALRRVDALNERMGSADFFGQGGTTFLRNAWVAAKWARARAAPEMRLIDDTWPDVEVRWPAVAGRAVTEQLEIVEADLPIGGGATSTNGGTPMAVARIRIRSRSGLPGPRRSQRP